MFFQKFLEENDFADKRAGFQKAQLSDLSALSAVSDGLLDQWLKELGFSSLGSRAKFMKALKDKLANSEKERKTKLDGVNSEIFDDHSNIFLPEYNRTVDIVQPIGWPQPRDYKAMILATDPAECMSDLKETNGSIGVVVSLLLSMVFLTTGKDVYAHPHSLWAKNVDTGQDVLTCVLIMDAAVCVCVIIFTTRLYLVLSMLPDDAGRLAMCRLGGSYCLSYCMFAFMAFAVLSLLALGLWASIALPKGTGLAMICAAAMLIIIQLLMVAFNQYWPGGTVDMRFEAIIEFLHFDLSPTEDSTRRSLHLKARDANKGAEGFGSKLKSGGK